ncbi:hypothetical protein, partial [Ciceribacter ferrooxidans]
MTKDVATLKAAIADIDKQMARLRPLAEEQAKAERAALERAAAEAARPIDVPIRTLLNEYRDNEVRADARFQNREV